MRSDFNFLWGAPAVKSTLSYLPIHDNTSPHHRNVLALAQILSWTTLEFELELQTAIFHGFFIWNEQFIDVGYDSVSDLSWIHHVLI